MQAIATNMTELNPGTVKKLSRINELANEAGKTLGLTVIDTHFTGQGKQKNLEICIYRSESAINFSDCEAMSRSFENLLEHEIESGTLVEDSFTITVVSPGLERRLTMPAEFMLFAGKAVRILTKKKIDGLGIEFIGTLIGGDEHSIMVSQTEPLLLKQGGKKNSVKPKLTSELGHQLTLSLSQIYGVYLWPNLKGAFLEDSGMKRGDRAVRNEAQIGASGRAQRVQAAPKLNSGTIAEVLYK